MGKRVLDKAMWSGALFLEIIWFKSLLGAWQGLDWNLGVLIFHEHLFYLAAAVAPPSNQRDGSSR